MLNLFVHNAPFLYPLKENSIFMLNPFAHNAPFLYPLKTLENVTAFWCFQGLEKGCIGNKWVKAMIIGKKEFKCMEKKYQTCTAWKVSKYGVFSGPYFPAFGLNTEGYVSLRIQFKCGKMRTRKSSVFGDF